nr:4-hydroxybenzoate octaprenyltransferase [Oceanococcus sp. HetDA_MAG_MS8]
MQTSTTPTSAQPAGVLALVLARVQAYAQLVRLDRPIGIWLLLWPTLWALWIAAEGVPPAPILVIFVLGTVLMRSAGCAINDFADRDFDGHVQRTRQRPLATGRIAPWEALLVFAMLCLLALGLVLQLNRLTVLLSLPAAALAASYPFAKRWTSLPQAHLGLAFAWGGPMAFAAVRAEVPPAAWLLLLITTLWAVIYDTFYAMVDREDDRKIGIKSTALLFGSADRMITAALQVLMLLLLGALGHLLQLGGYYAAGLSVAAMLMLWQQWRIRHREPAACLAAFLNNHWLGAAVFLGLFLDYAPQA